MQTNAANLPHHSDTIRRAATEPQKFPPLEFENRPAVDTATAAHYVNRQPQTLRGWASAGNHPPELTPLRINGRLAWPVAGILKVLGVTR
ncbi:MAG: hypothetical protein RIS44_1649 [Pseudomonadota bacterium]|jgi:hypothetical protein